MTDKEDFLQEPEIRIPEITLALGEVELEVSVSLLAFFHGGIPEMVKVHILDVPVDAIGKPSVHEPSSCLAILGLGSGKGNQMHTGIPAIVVHSQSRDGSISAIAYIASDGVFAHFGHGAVVPDVVGLEKVLHLHCLEGFGKCFPVHELYPDIRLGEEFLAGTFRSLVPLLVVFAVLEVRKPRSHEVGSDGQFPPSGRYFGATERHPYGKSADESVVREKLLRRFCIYAVKLHELHIFPEKPFHPAETTSCERDGMDVAVFAQVPVVNGRSAPVVGVVFRKFGVLYDSHGLERGDRFSGSIEIKIKFQFVF